MKSAFLRTIVPLLCFFLLGCSSVLDPEVDLPFEDISLEEMTLEEIENGLEYLEQDIDKLIGDARASNESACQAIGMGAKPCGGPWRYVAYSEEETDTEALKALIERHKELQAEYNTRKGLFSDCRVTSYPGVTLQNRVCVLKSHQ